MLLAKVPSFARSLPLYLLGALYQRLRPPPEAGVGVVQQAVPIAKIAFIPMFKWIFRRYLAHDGKRIVVIHASLSPFRIVLDALGDP